MGERRIAYIEEGSIAERCGILPGESIVSLNGESDFDIIDYLAACADDSVELVIKDAGGSLRKITADNDGMSPFGISFENITADAPRVCRNHCVFCFMDQMPRGLRRSLYFKDDDYRLSFLMGNYITLTNVSDDELERIVDMRMSPLNISVHVTDPELRKRMMRNDDAPKILSQLKRLMDGGIEYNIQLVLCPGINDGIYLEKSLEDMLGFIPAVRSLSCVPVGLTRYREGLTDLRSYTQPEAQTVIDTVAAYAERARALDEDVRFCASDEFFLLAGRDFPEDDYYGDYVQYENGVGMARSFIDSVDEYITGNPDTSLSGLKAFAVTGELGSRVISGPLKKINEKLGSDITVLRVDNGFFGSSVTASGLVCGCDILNTLEGAGEGEVLIPSNMLKDDEDVFLDGMTLEELTEKSGRTVHIVDHRGYEFCEDLRGITQK